MDRCEETEPIVQILKELESDSVVQKLGLGVLPMMLVRSNHQNFRKKLCHRMNRDWETVELSLVPVDVEELCSI